MGHFDGLEVKGETILPGDAQYDEARALFYGGVDKHPAAIVRVADADDVSRVVRHAREAGTELAVKSGGHNPLGFSVSEGGLVIDLHALRRVEIDAAGRTAWADAGTTAAEFSNAAGAHGLGVSFGDTGSVGLGGLVLGGGIGYLARSHGLTIDNLIAAEVVTADGAVRLVDAVREPDLFWAIRGGGGNFGVATRFRFRLHPVDPFVGGMLMQPATAETVHDFMTLSHAAPDELTTIANVMPAPAMPFVPPEWHGKLVLMSFVCYAGDPARAERAIAPLRALAPSIVDMVKPMPYPQIYPPEDPSYHPIGLNRNLFVDGIDRGAAESIVAHLGASKATFAVAQLRTLGGAVARVPADATAFAHRDRRVMVNLAFLVETTEALAVHRAWLDAFATDIQRGPEGSYVNFVMAEGATGVRRSYPGATLDRLAALKRRYDPTNLFRLNQNIPPAGR